MFKLLLVSVVLGAVGYSYFLYQNNELPFVSSPVSTVSIDDKIKCTTKEGRILYGKVPEGTICEKYESVKGSMVMLINKEKSATDKVLDFFNGDNLEK